MIIDAKSGVSGAGKAATDRTHFSENHGSVAAYGVFSHRHTAEMEQELDRAGHVRAAPGPAQPRHPRDDLRARRRPGTTAAAVGAASARARTRTRRSCGCGTTGCPRSSTSAYTPFCDIGWRVDEATSRLVIVACLDNLLKGAASQAVQNLNLMCGLDERTGLL